MAIYIRNVFAGSDDENVAHLTLYSPVPEEAHQLVGEPQHKAHQHKAVYYLQCSFEGSFLDSPLDNKAYHYEERNRPDYSRSMATEDFEKLDVNPFRNSQIRDGQALPDKSIPP